MTPFIQTFFTALSQNELALINKEIKKRQLCGKPVISHSFQKVLFEFLTNFLGCIAEISLFAQHISKTKSGKIKGSLTALICLLLRSSQYGQRFQCG